MSELKARALCTCSDLEDEVHGVGQRPAVEGQEQVVLRRRGNVAHHLTDRQTDRQIGIMM